MFSIRSKQEVAAQLSADLPKIGSCIRGAWESYQSQYSPALRARHSSLSRAALVHDEMVLQAEKAFEGRPGVICRKVQRMFVVSFSANLVVRFKKFDDNFGVSNVPTKQSLSFINQQFDLPGVDQATTLHAGYRLNKLETALEGCYVVCPRGYGHEWILNLEDLEAGDNNVLRFPKQPMPPPAGFKLRLVQKDKEANDDL